MMVLERKGTYDNLHVLHMCSHLLHLLCGFVIHITLLIAMYTYMLDSLYKTI